MKKYKKSKSTTDVYHTLFAHFMKYVIKKLDFYSFGGFCLICNLHYPHHISRFKTILGAMTASHVSSAIHDNFPAKRMDDTRESANASDHMKM